MSDKLTGIKSQFVRNAPNRQVGAIFVNLAKYQQVIRYLKLKIFFKFEVMAQILRIGTEFVPFQNGGLVPEHRNHPLE
jgi:hypothetical protein